MAILLKEEGLYERTRIYATDANESVLAKARKGIYSLANMQANTRNYNRSGGRGSLSDHFHASYDHALFDQQLKTNMVFFRLADDVPYSPTDFVNKLRDEANIWLGTNGPRGFRAVTHYWVGHDEVASFLTVINEILLR